MLVAMALISSVAFTNCAAKKPVKKVAEVQQIDPQQARLDSLRKAAEIRRLEREIQNAEEDDALEREAKRAEKEAEMEIARLKAANARKSTTKRVGQDLYTPCLEESYDMPGEYMAGLGIAEGEDDRGEAKLLANKYAVEDIAKRYVGMIKNGMEHYAQKASTASGNKIRENKLEGDATVIGQKAIEKYAEQVCIKFEQDDMGGYTCYIAIHVPLKEVLNTTIDEIGALKTDFDRQQFRNFMQAELDKQAAAKEAEKKEMQEMRQLLEQ